MENQHQRISGYRELNQTEIDLINEIKTLGINIEAVVIRVQAHIREQRNDTGDNTPEEERLNAATPERFAAMSVTQFQTGLMYLTRAVGQPTHF